MIDTKKFNGELTNVITREQVENLLIKQLTRLFGKKLGERIYSESKEEYKGDHYSLQGETVRVFVAYEKSTNNIVNFDASLHSENVDYMDKELGLDLFCRVDWLDQNNQDIIANDIFHCLLSSITLPQLVNLINLLSKSKYYSMANTYYVFQQYYNNFGYRFNEELNEAFLKFYDEHMDDFIDWLIVNEKILDKAFAQSKNADKYAAITYAMFINSALVIDLDKAKNKAIVTKLLDWSNKVNITDQSVVEYAISDESDKLSYKLKLQYLPAIAATFLEHDKEEDEDDEVVYLDNLATINFEVKGENDIDMFVDEIVDNPQLIPAIKKIVNDYPYIIHYNNHQKDLKALAATAKRHTNSSVFKTIYQALHEIFSM